MRPLLLPPCIPSGEICAPINRAPDLAELIGAAVSGGRVWVPYGATEHNPGPAELAGE